MKEILRNMAEEAQIAVIGFSSIALIIGFVIGALAGVAIVLSV